LQNSSCVVVDYGIGNVFSVMNALKACGANPVLTGDHKEILASDRVILPGVGAFGRASNRLSELGLDNTLKEFAATQRPLMGICVGMQLLMSTGTEFGDFSGLDLIEGTVEKVNVTDDEGKQRKVPLIGWYPLETSQTGTDCLFSKNAGNEAYYFVHSFAVLPSNEDHITANVNHDGSHIVAAVQNNNIFGVQFHPERSSTHGLALLDNFLTI